ncbi:hypothetical protein HY469_01645 [Candidatus Roizmanbacteria bacterium]|nr:hypothetical protein [Candidatus Roizmanbacteria bacterium]
MVHISSKWKIDVQFIEHGDIYFFYKPKKSVRETRGIQDVARFFIVLAPEGPAPHRYIVMGNKTMPRTEDSEKTTWGFVQIIGGRGFEIDTKQKGLVRKGASRPAGEGIYTIIKHRDHTHLLYSLELPEKTGEVQNAFNIQQEANYIMLERSVEHVPRSPDLPFSNFSPVTLQDLNRRGTEVLFIGVGSDIGRLGIRAEKDPETIKTADIFSTLKLSSDRHPIESLISGNWE